VSVCGIGGVETSGSVPEDYFRPYSPLVKFMRIVYIDCTSHNSQNEVIRKRS
jgi:hypothetical protein